MFDNKEVRAWVENFSETIHPLKSISSVMRSKRPSEHMEQGELSDFPHNKKLIFNDKVLKMLEQDLKKLEFNIFDL